MKLGLSLVLILFGLSICAAQKKDETEKTAGLPPVLKKQILVDELDAQAKNLALPAVRIYVRTELARWLWRNGNDETGRAEALAIKAVEELYEKRSEISDAPFFDKLVFALLDKYAKETSAKLRVKYNVKSRDLFGAFPSLKEKGSDQAFAESIKSDIPAEKDFAVTSLKISYLQKQNSPEAASALAEIINVHETGRNTLSSQSLLWVSRNITDASVPKDLKIRFYRIALNAARNAVQTSIPYEIQFTDSMLYEILPDMTANAPELAAEGNALKIALLGKTSQRMKDYQASDQRIKESANKLDATIAEAEQTNDAGLKYNLYRNASDLALKEGKFQLAADLIGKTIENSPIKIPSPMETVIASHDLQLNQIMFEALKKDDVESAVYASKKIVNDLKRAEALRVMAIHFHEKKDSAAALAYYDEALKLAAAASSDKSRFGLLFALIYTAAEIDRSRVPEVVSMSARAINQLPSLSPEDKPGTEKYKDYAATIMAINMRLFAGLLNLIRKDKTAAVEFSERINRKEIKIIADLVAGIGTIENEQKISELK